MTENFITKITVENSRNVKDLEINLSEYNRQHLIFTGKNGSGKTSLLLELNKFLTQIENGNFQHYQNQLKRSNDLKLYLKSETNTVEENKNLESNLKATKDWLSSFGGTKIKFSTSELAVFDNYQEGKFLVAFFDSKRQITLNIPKAISKVELKNKYNLNEKANTAFIQYIVNLKAERSFAKDDNELDVVKEIDSWFERFEKRLKFIFDVDDLKLQFNRNTYNFDIITGQGEKFSFNTLSDGYSSIISIITEILLRMEAQGAKLYNLEGIVIIDEIETHLHVDLQKKILPFLTDFFPNVQFIVTTHSPFVLSSLSNATICDLETRTITTDLSGYSYDALLESYFKTDKYSEEIKNKIIEFEYLTSFTEINNDEKQRLRHLRNYFAHAPKYLSTELLVKLQQIELNELNKK